MQFLLFYSQITHFDNKPYLEYLKDVEVSLLSRASLNLKLLKPWYLIVHLFSIFALKVSLLWEFKLKKTL